MSCNVNSFLDPNFAMSLHRKYGKIKEIVPKIQAIIEEFRKNHAPSRFTSTSKNNFKSIELREEAKIMTDKKNPLSLSRALERYNESICYAELKDDVHLASLFVDRAVVCFDLAEYEHCWQNITLAEGCGYMENDSNRLGQLKANCLAELKNKQTKQKPDSRTIQVNVKAHPRIPFAASCLELKNSSTCGRYVVTNEDIAAGSIIITESPFVKVLSSDCLYMRCSNCLQGNSMNLLPCSNCTKAMFCSKKCLLEAGENFHKYECPIIECLTDIGGQITVRTFLKAIQSFTSIYELKEFVQSANACNVTPFSFDHSKKLSPQQHYHQIHSLSTNKDVRSDLEIFTHVIVVALFYYQLSYHSPFKDALRVECEDETLIELLFRVELITTINTFNFNDLVLMQEDKVIGTGLYQLSSLLNHSCSPNTSPKYYNGNLVLYATQPIKQGESISISYKYDSIFYSSIGIISEFFLTLFLVLVMRSHPKRSDERF